MNVTVYFSFVCPYTYRFYRFLQRNNVEDGLNIFWKPFVLAEQNRKDETPIWELQSLPEHAELMTLAGLEAAKDTGANVEMYINDAFRLWHEGKEKPLIQRVRDLHNKHKLPEVTDYIEDVALSHRAAKDIGVFGTPTAQFEDTEEPMFIKLETTPENDEETFNQILGAAKNSSLAELKKV